METRNSIEPSTSWAGVIAALAILLAPSGVLLLSKISYSLFGDLTNLDSPLLTLISLLALVLMFGIPVTGFGAGWLKGFPRWVFPYASFTLLFTTFIASASTPGIIVAGYEIFGRELWGWRASVPLLGMLAVVLFLTRKDPFKPFDSLLDLLRRDFTPLTFAFFGLLPLGSWIAFDEIDDRFEFPFLLLNHVMIVVAAVLYLRSTRFWQRAAALFAGSLVVIAVATLAPIQYWMDHGGVNVPQSLVNGIFFLFLFNSPTLLEFLRKPPPPSPERPTA